MLHQNNGGMQKRRRTVGSPIASRSPRAIEQPDEWTAAADG